MATCEVCGTNSPAGAAFCPTCGHRLGAAPREPIIVEVRQAAPEPSVARSAWDGCIGCLAWLVLAVLVFLLITWLLSC